MLYIVVATFLHGANISYCTKPATLDGAQAQLAQLVRSVWIAEHAGFKAPRIINSADPNYAKILNGYTYDDEAANRHGIVVAPCRPF